MLRALHILLFGTLIALFSLIFSGEAVAQCGDSIDLGTWIQEGDTNNGNWVVTNGGNTVNQTINGDPTFYVSPDSFLNVIITGNIQVATTNDNDWIGFVFGYVDPDSTNPTNYDFYLFDWKQGDQNFGGFFGPEGYSLSKVTGPVTNLPQAFSAKAGPFVDLLASNYGNTLGWNSLQTYSFALTYTNTRTVISIDGDTIFDIFGCFPPGRFGFYNYSQSDVNYSDFSYRVAAAFDVLTPDVCLGDTAKFVALSDSCVNAAGIPVNNTLTGWFWDFGDGSTSNDTNGQHLYANPGQYTVSLEVTDYLGCKDTAYSTVNIWNVQTDLGADTAICTGDFVTLDADTNSTGYLWSTGATTQTISVTNPGSYWVIVNGEGGCLDTDTVVVTNIALPVVNIGNDTSICNNDTLPLTISGAQTYSWGPIYNATSLVGDSISVYPTVDTTYYVQATDINGCVNYDTINVAIDTLPIITLTSTGDSVCNLDTTVITAGGAVTYTWVNTPGLNTYTGSVVEAFPNSTTLYTAIGTDGNGCVNSSDITVTVLPLPDIDVQPGIGQICVGETEEITAQNYYSYVWSPMTNLVLDGNNNDTVLASPVDTTTFTVTATDSLGCSSDTTYQLAVTPLPVITVTADDSVICPGVPTSLHVTGAISYQWGPSVAISGVFGASPTVSPFSTQEYFVTATGPGGCQSIDSITLAVYEIDTFSAGEDTAICRKDTIQFNAFGGVSYQWNPNIGISDPTVPNSLCFTNDTRLYVVSITDANGCVSTDQIQIQVNPLPYARPGDDDTICAGQSTRLGGMPTGPAGSTYTWTPATGLDNAGLPNPNASPGVTTTYTVLVTDVNGCMRENSVDIRVNDLPEMEVLEEPDYLCQRDSAQLRVTPGLEDYEWSPVVRILDTGNPTVTVYPLDTITYYVSGTDTNGCTTTLGIKVDVKRAPFVNIRGNYDMCWGDTIEFDANAAPGILEWSPPEYVSQDDTLTPVAFPLEPTYFTLKVTDDLGCSNLDSSLVFVHPLPRIDAGQDVENCSMQVVYLGGPSVTGPENEILWSPADKLNDPTIEHPRVLSTEIDTFVLRVESPEGCVSFDSIVVNSDCYISLYAPNSFTPDGDGNNDVFNVYGRNIYNSYLVIYDRWGHILFESRDIEVGWDGNHSNGYPAQIGTYFWQILYQDENGRDLSDEGLFNLIR